MKQPMQIKKAKADAPLWVPQVNEMCEYNHPDLGWIRCRIVSARENLFYEVEAEVMRNLRAFTCVRPQNLREGTAPASKKDQIVRLLKTGETNKALAMAAKFQDLGEHRDAITKANNALKSPDFYRQIKQDPDALVAAGVAALRARYLA